MLRSTLFVLATLGLPAVSDAAVASFQNGVNAYSGTGDTEMYGYGETIANWNNGGGNVIQLGTNDGGSRRGLVRFDGLGVMAGQYISINSATLTMTQAGNFYPQFQVDVHQIVDANAAWVEGNTVISAAAAGEPTWNNLAHPGTPWSGGAGLSGGGYVAAPLDSETYTQTIGAPVVFNLPPSLIVQWITGVNAGLLLKMNNEAFFSAGPFYTSEDSTVSNRPLLTIDYTAVPEPSSLALLGIVGLMGVRRRQ